jgi:hypothetical protein
MLSFTLTLFRGEIGSKTGVWLCALLGTISLVSSIQRHFTPEFQESQLLEEKLPARV